MSVLTIEQWCDKALNNATEAYQETSHSMSAAVQDGSPIDTTAFFRSWTASIGDKIEVKDVSPEEARRGGFGVDEIKPVTDKLKLGDQYNFGNPKVYGPLLEYEGHSSQAPRGMVRINLAKYQAFTRKAAANALRT